MSHEIELKLALAPSGPEALRHHPRLSGLRAHRRPLSNTYFDTPQGDLEGARMALRLRRIGDDWYQTLKTSGQGGGGLSTRGEWEWPVADARLDLAGLAELPPLQSLGAGVLERLTPRFTTDFVRETWDLEDAGQHIELALDQGEIRAGDGRVEIRELELELKSGNSQRLLDLAEGFSESVALRPSDTSKAARGAALLAGDWRLPAGNTPAELMHRANVALDALGDNPRPAWRQAAIDALARLRETAGEAPGVGDDCRELIERLSNACHDDWLTPTFGAILLRLARRLPDSVDFR
ncbi:CYTH domain-containing protein [Halomonas sp. V046]|uniref:CYTH domain-containing protein n=1 Tax=Halomonas sp. V046 TaxID=3459611 RepID=UPI004044BCFB